MPSSTYDYGITPGSGANREDIGGSRRRKSPKKRSEERDKVGIVMHEFKEGTLHSSSGQPVTDRKQAIAIALSEQRRHNRGKKK